MSEAKEISPIEQPESATIAAKDRDDSVASEMDGRDSRIAELEKAPMLDPEKGRVEKSDTSSPETPAAAKKEEKNKAADAAAFAFCFVGLQVSFMWIVALVIGQQFNECVDWMKRFFLY